MQTRIERFAGFEYSLSNCHEFAHHRHDDDLGGLARSLEPMHEWGEGFAAAVSHYGRHIQRMAQVSVAALGDTGLTLYAGARLVRFWAQAEERNCALGAGKALAIA